MRLHWPHILPNLLAFLSSCWVMVIELVASRLVAQYIGSSVYTWTSVIGVILAGISLGNYFGGILADRGQPRRTIGFLFLGSAAMVLLALVLHPHLGDAVTGMESLPWGARIVLVVATIFFLPAVCLGTIGPVAAKMAVEAHEETGRAIGNVYAWGAIGSIVGTFMTGYWLIQVLGTSMILATAAGAMGLIGLLMLGAQRAVTGKIPAGQIALFLVVLGTIAPWPLPGRAEALQRAALERESRWTGRTVTYVKDSTYYHIRAQYLPSPRKGTSIALVLDTLIHGLWVPSDPLALEYEYEKIYALITRRYQDVPADALTGWEPMRALFIGGGAYTFPRYLQEVAPGSHCEVMEIDPLVVEACHVAVGLARDTSIKTHIGDARRTIDAGLEGPFDVIYGDAFNDFSVPWHLTTVEFLTTMKALLAEDGLYLMNLVDLYDPTDPGRSRFLASMVRTLESVFGTEQVAVFASLGDVYAPAGSATRTTFVIACGNRPEHPAMLDNLGSDPLRDPPRIQGERLNPVALSATERAAFRDSGIVLTDEYAPVDQLLLPVAASRG